MTDMTPTHPTQASVDEVRQLRKLVEEMLEYSTYETEYDGRMYSICHDCGAQDGEPHRDKNCLYLRARAAIARATSLPNEANHD
jgi:hypothetical protein